MAHMKFVVPEDDARSVIVLHRCIAPKVRRISLVGIDELAVFYVEGLIAPGKHVISPVGRSVLGIRRGAARIVNMLRVTAAQERAVVDHAKLRAEDVKHKFKAFCDAIVERAVVNTKFCRLSVLR